MKMLLLAFVLALSGCSQKKKNQPTLSQVFDSYWEEHSRLFPIDATQQGDNRYNYLLPNDQTAAYRKVLRDYFNDYLNRLGKFDREKLSENDKVSYDIFKYEMEMQLEGLSTDLYMIPFQQFWGLPLTMAQIGSGEQFQPFKTVQDYENWMKRVDGLTVWTDSAIDNFREGMRQGVVLPKVLVKKILPQMKDIVSRDPKKSVFYGPVKKFPKEFTPAVKMRLTDAYTRMIVTKINPTYQKIHDFLQKEYLPKARDTHGISAIPNGTYLYNYLARLWTTTNKSPEEIYQTGLSEVERIQKEMLKVKDQVGYKGDLKSFFAHLRKDKKLMPYKNAEQVLNLYRGIYKRMQPQLLTMFGRTPKTPFEIRQTEKFREASASAEYSPGSPDGSRAGIFYIPIPEPKKFNITSGTESLFLHEAIPGHHYQISLQQENEDLPKFRRFAWYGAMGEGWALYSESLGKELGLYTDPYHYMGALGDEMHRACRLVVDVGIHLKKMTREEAIKYLLDHEPIPEKDAIAEVERYMAVPAQALSYKVGALKIRELRTKYENELGDKFKLSAFHDEVLRDGVMPLATLEKKLDAWAARQ
ncbi:MAG: DUF885 domain-containing protein [Bacteriovoracaceae bacterium]